MSLLSVLKTVGKDLSHVGQWIDDGLKIVGPEITVLNPALGPIVSAVESAIEELEAMDTKAPLSAATVQQVVTAVTTLESIKPGLTASLGKKLPVPVGQTAIA